MIVNRANLESIFTGYKAAFQGGLGQHEAQWQSVATRVPSTTGTEEYGWLGQIPNVREWLGERHVHNLQLHDYTIKNRKFELTIAVDVDSIEDDTFGVFAPMFTEMGRSVAAHPDQLIWSLLKAGWSTACYDGQPFFDTDHPVLDEAGQPVSMANTDGGSGAPWFLIDTSRALKPVLYQVRKEFDFVSRTRPDDPAVFDKDEYVYGVKGRSNVGFGFWQFAWGSKQTLTADRYEAGRAAIMGMKGDYGRPLGLMPRLLVTGPAGERAALEILNAERDAAGATNVYRGTAQLLVVPWLA